MVQALGLGVFGDLVERARGAAHSITGRSASFDIQKPLLSLPIIRFARFSFARRHLRSEPLTEYLLTLYRTRPGNSTPGVPAI
jgi:hypothetical protein